jgi:hypothetical protein
MPMSADVALDAVPMTETRLPNRGDTIARFEPRSETDEEIPAKRDRNNWELASVFCMD